MGYVRSALLAAVAAAGAVHGMPAFAQDTPPAPTGQARGDDQSADATAQPIIVTATRREQSLQQTPISIIAFDKAAIDRQGLRTLTDIETATPGISFASKGGSGTSSGFVTARGLFDLARNVGFEQRVGVYIDGVYMGRTYNLDQTVLGLERIEVLRGPQGTLFGKSTPAGAINITTRLPGDAFRFEANAEVGNFDYRLINAYVSGPLSDKVSASIGFEVANRDGYTREAAFPDIGFNQINRYAGRAALRFRPAADLDIILRADAQKAHTPLATLEDNVVSDPRPYHDSTDFLQTDRNSSFGTSLEIDKGLGGGNLISITAYRTGSFRIRNDTDRSPHAFLIDQLDERLKQFSEEVRFVSRRTARFDFVTGLFFMDQHLSAQRLIETGADFGLVIPGEGAGLFDHGPSRLTSTNVAGFANANFRLNDVIELTAGARVSSDHKRIRYDLIEGIGLFVNIPNYRDSRTDTEFTPRAGVNLHLSPNVMLYASYARGYTAGGWNADWVADPHIAFGAEHVNNYEAGLRSTFAGGHILLNATGFWTDLFGLQVPQFINTPNGLIAVNITNAGSGVSKGVEAETVLKPFRGLTLTGSGTYNDAHYKRFPGCGFVGGAVVACDGNRLIFAPKWKAYASVEYRTAIKGVPGHVFLFGEYSYESSIYSDSLNTAPNFAPGFDEINLRLGWEPNDRVTITAWVRNLENDANIRYQQVGLLGTPFVLYNPPRTYGLKVGYRF
ncbi:MAG TPA: TonB-dependent receptor [Allosphingosinicella sp.]|nr:TonB-dependent receptor [Allosphingosinicella sp.]